MKSFILRSWIFSARLAGGLGLLLSAVGATGQSPFQNLDFEMATITPAPAGYTPWNAHQPISAADALPFWTVREDTTVCSAIWGAYGLDETSVNLVNGGPHPDYPALQGVYSLQLYASTMGPPEYFQSASISQTGLIPAGTHSIWFLMEISPVAGMMQSSPSITINGTPINISPMSSSGGVITMAGDISAFSGMTADLSIQCTADRIIRSGPPYTFENIYTLDAIQFSPTEVPEPGCFGLFALGALLLGHRGHRQRYAVHPLKRK